MRTAILLLLLICAFGCTSSAHLRPSSDERPSIDVTIERNRKLLEVNADDAGAYTSLKEMLDRAQPMSDQQVKTIRELLHRYARSGKASLVNKQEPGDRLVITGKVTNLGKGIPGAIIYAFQTDATGHYSRNSTMNEGNPRLYAYLKSGSDGSFEFETIRPGGYPAPAGRETEQNLIPQHIHLQVTAQGFEFRNLEFVFADDPRMTPYWRDWAVNRGHSILTVTRNSEGVQGSTADIALRAQ